MTPQNLAYVHAAAFTQSRPWTADEFAGLLANPFTHLVANNRSFALFQVIADEVELLTIATHPRVQRQGLAFDLMRDWHEKAQELGATRAFLDVAADNQPAIALYERFRYMPCGRRKAYYQVEKGQKIDAIVMERNLR